MWMALEKACKAYYTGQSSKPKMGLSRSAPGSPLKAFLSGEESVSPQLGNRMLQGRHGFSIAHSSIYIR